MGKSPSQETYDPVQLTARIITFIPIIILKSGTAWISFKRRANKGSKTFHKELLKQGIDKQTAKLLTKQYIDGSNLLETVFNRSS
mgnify:CR=1 FL=1